MDNHKCVQPISRGINSLDFTEPSRIIRHFRDLNNVANLIDYAKEVDKFIIQLQEAGWSNSKIHEFQISGTKGTRFERDIPRVLPDRGDRTEFLRRFPQKR